MVSIWIVFMNVPRAADDPERIYSVASFSFNCVPKHYVLKADMLCRIWIRGIQSLMEHQQYDICGSLQTHYIPR